MIVRFFNTGTGNGEAPVKYLLSAHSHDGEERAHKPELLEGSPALTIELINGRLYECSGVHPISSSFLTF